MVKKVEYDLRIWKSFPSSLKLTSNELTPTWHSMKRWFTINPGSVIDVEVNAKQGKVTHEASRIYVNGRNGEGVRLGVANLPPHTIFDWTKFAVPTFTVPADVSFITVYLIGGGTTNPEEPAETWYDDLRIYQDGVLIFENKFSKWGPTLIGGGIIAVILAAIFGGGRKRRKG